MEVNNTVLWNSVNDVFYASLDLCKGPRFVRGKLRAEEVPGVFPFRAVLREDAATKKGAESRGAVSQVVIYSTKGN